MTANKMVATHVRDQQLPKNVSTVLSAPGLLAKWPMIGLIMFIFGSLMFGGLTYNLFNNGPLLKWDTALATTLPSIALKSPPFVRYLMELGFYLGTTIATILGVLVGIYLLVRRYWEEFFMLLIGTAGSSTLWYSLSNYFGRPRPPTQIWNVLKIPGYPSGHSIAAVVFYGLMAYWLAPKMRSAFGKVLVVFVALFLMVFIGFSRVFTAGHYLTDVLAGYAIGIAWFGFIFTLIEMYFRRRRNLHASKE